MAGEPSHVGGLDGAWLSPLPFPALLVGGRYVGEETLGRLAALAAAEVGIRFSVSRASRRFSSLVLAHRNTVSPTTGAR